MNQSQPRHGTWRYWAMGLAVFVATAGVPSLGQAPTGAAARPPANPNAPLMVLSPKAKSAGWTGVHKPHTKLADVLARHKGQTDWAETIVDDESLLAQWISIGPGKKTPYPMDDTPVPVKGFEYVPTRVTGGRGVLDAQNRPVVDFNKVVAGQERGGAFVTDDRQD